ncbi:hypothetical protein GDO81_014274 [Engystomops pustulosus]|uniref:Uncharacterized protein n=1 Tax=Engystomops pustulosus TaxID=76066 RepID=A0AAV7B982_ENGPU|nr:hypothetical protein GDO81_014274 [Engystomops pustulosus]
MDGSTHALCRPQGTDIQELCGRAGAQQWRERGRRKALTLWPIPARLVSSPGGSEERENMKAAGNLRRGTYTELCAVSDL